MHANAPLTPAGRLRLCERIAAGRPIAHVAAEAGVSRQSLSKWYARWLAEGEAGLSDVSSRPRISPNATAPETVAAVLALRSERKWGPARITADLNGRGIEISHATVHRILERNGVNKLRFIDPPTGEPVRIQRYEYQRPGEMIHVDIKKLGRIPDGGGWRAHGRDTEAGRASKRGPKIGYTYLHSAVDDYSRFAYTEALEDEKATTAAGFWQRAAAFFRENGIRRFDRVLTDNGSCYRSAEWAQSLAATLSDHRRTRPYTPRTNGKVERYNGTLSREWAYVRVYTSEQARRDELTRFLAYYNHERPHSALGHKPPVTRLGVVYRLSPYE